MHWVTKPTMNRAGETTRPYGDGSTDARGGASAPKLTGALARERPRHAEVKSGTEDNYLEEAEAVAR